MLEVEARVCQPLETYLRSSYGEDHKTTTEIAEEIGVGRTTINRWLNDYGIELRTNSESQLPIGFSKPSEERLRTLYVDEHKTTTEMSEEFGVSNTTINKWLNDYGIELRTTSETKFPHGFSKPSEERLRTLYIDEHKTPGEIAEEFGVGSTTILTLLNDYDIELRTISESKLPKGFVKPSKEQLRTDYIDKHKSQTRMAQELGVGISTMNRWLKEYNINRDQEELNELEDLVRGYFESD